MQQCTKAINKYKYSALKISEPASLILPEIDGNR